MSVLPRGGLHPQTATARATAPVAQYFHPLPARHGQASAQSPGGRAFRRALARRPEAPAPKICCCSLPRCPRRAVLSGAIPCRRLALAGDILGVGVGLAALVRRIPGGGGRRRRRSGEPACFHLLLMLSILPFRYVFPKFALWRWVRNSNCADDLVVHCSV